MSEDRPKKTTRPLLIAASALILLGAGTLAFFKMPAFHNLLHPHPGDNTAKVAQGPTKYTCPMHPFIVSDKPGACPICGMTLVPPESMASAAGAAGEAGGEAERERPEWDGPG